MREIVVQEFISLDGVIQGPGAVDEDPEGGFEHGGWTSGYDDDGDDDLVGEWESHTEALLLGRKTYDVWARSWGVWDETAPGFIGDLNRRYNRIPKYVASRTLTEVGWKNSHLLGADVAGEVARLRDAPSAEPGGEPGAEPGGELRVWGSSELVRTLAEHDLVDEYRLLTYPIVVGHGKKLFADGFPFSRLAVTETRLLPSGVQLTIYRRA